MTFANFITIQYNLLIERLPVVSSLFTNIWIFAITFVALYLPVSILIGYWHRKSQWKVEAEAMFKENEIGAKMWLFLIDLVEGKATEEEKENMRELLEKIAKKNSTTISTIDKDKKTAESRAYNGLKKF